MLIVRWWADQRGSYTAVCRHTKHGRERTRDRRTRMMWAIELEVDYAQWCKLVKAKVDDKVEREKWIKMCHRLGSQQAKDIVASTTARLNTPR